MRKAEFQKKALSAIQATSAHDLALHLSCGSPRNRMLIRPTGRIAWIPASTPIEGKVAYAVISFEEDMRYVPLEDPPVINEQYQQYVSDMEALACLVVSTLSSMVFDVIRYCDENQIEPAATIRKNGPYVSMSVIRPHFSWT